MKKVTIIVIVAVVAVIAIWATSGYNNLVSMDENVSNQWANVETQYQRPYPQLGKHRQGLCCPRKGDAGGRYRRPQPGHSNQSEPYGPDTRKACRISKGTGTVSHRLRQVAGHH